MKHITHIINFATKNHPITSFSSSFSDCLSTAVIVAVKPVYLMKTRSLVTPRGTNCNGWGFTDTQNIILAPGKPVPDSNGNLQSLDVSKGCIIIKTQITECSRA